MKNTATASNNYTFVVAETFSYSCQDIKVLSICIYLQAVNSPDCSVERQARQRLAAMLALRLRMNRFAVILRLSVYPGRPLLMYQQKQTLKTDTRQNQNKMRYYPFLNDSRN